MSIKEQDDFISNSIQGYEGFEIDAELKYFMTPMNLEQTFVKQVFKKLDRSGNGYLDEKELLFFLNIIDLEAKEEEIREMVKMLDHESNGRVTEE